MNHQDASRWADEVEKSLVAAEQKWRALFKRHGFTFPEGQMLNHPSNIAFARVVEKEHAAHHMVDFPIARQIFMLGYMYRDVPMGQDADSGREG